MLRLPYSQSIVLHLLVDLFLSKVFKFRKAPPPTNHFEADRKGLILAALPSSLRSSEPLNLRCWVALLTINPSASRQSSHLYRFCPRNVKWTHILSNLRPVSKLVEPHRASLCIDQPSTTMDDKVVNFTKPKCLPELFTRPVGVGFARIHLHVPVANNAFDRPNE